MGTIIYDAHGVNVRRFSGGAERGVCYSFHASGAVLTESEVQRLKENEKRHLVVQSDNHDAMLKLEEERDGFKARAESAEAERDTLKEQLEDNKWMAELIISKRLKDSESRLAKAQEMPDALFDEAVKIVRATCLNVMGELLQGERLQDIVIFHLEGFKNNLKESLGCAGGEDEK